MTGFNDSGGSVIKNIPTQREAKVYPLFEAEMKSLGVLNFFSSLCISASAACFSYYFALKLQKEVTKDMSNVTAEGIVIMEYGPKLCFWSAVIFLLISIALFLYKGSEVKRIKSEAKQRTSELENNAQTSPSLP